MLEYCPMRVKENGNCSPMGGFCQPDTEICKALHAAYESGTFNAGLSASNQPTIPLTLEQLREMDGEPVWVVGISSINNFKGHWDICDWENGEVVTFPYCMESPDIDLYGKTWLAYRHRPEEETV